MSIKVLAVDDVPEILEDIGYTLSRAGYRIFCAVSAQSFWQLFEQQNPDIVLLDIGLPDGSGLEISRRLRTQHPDIGIIMLTGRSLLADRLNGRSAGADDYLTKPVQMDELVLVLQNLVRRLRLDQRQHWVVQVQALRLNAPTGAHVELTRSELHVIKAFAADSNQQATRQRIVTSLGYAWETYDERRLETIMSRFKRKLMTEFNLADSPIRSLRGEGYAFTEPLRLA